MSTPFIHADFLLSTEEARRLYHEYAEDQPIIDYHCHLPPEQVSTDHRFENLTQIWLSGDHYKWRGMRSNGVAERFCTGDATDREKFDAWAATVPKCLRNPLYHWTHLELNRPFGINDRLLSPDTAESIWNECNAMLATDAFSAQGIQKQMKVELICTTDDPVDSLEHHLAHAAKGAGARPRGDRGAEHPEGRDNSDGTEPGPEGAAPPETRMLPTWRPDKAMAVEDPASWNTWVDRLGAACDRDIRSYGDLLQSLSERHDVFHEAGCRLSDHGIETAYAEVYTHAELEQVFDTVRGGDRVGEDLASKFKSGLMVEFGRMDHAKGWTQQIHYGVIRNTNSRLFEALGPDTGFDSIGDFEVARPLARFLDSLDRTDQLPRTILYNINPGDNEVIGTMIGNFQDGSIPGKMQFGSGWWFLDQWDGMKKQMEALSNLGLLSRFVGMLTDSRSFLSYTRHEYFRRLLCELLGDDMVAGRIPRDFDLVGEMVADISYRNARDYFGF